jgi:cysteine synthase A
MISIGNTPLIPIELDGKKIWGKAEFMNPSGSIKDRPASNIIKRALEKGELKQGGTLVEATSGNAGISFAMLCAWYKIHCVIIMPSNMSEERKKMISFYGAELIEVAPGDFDGAIKLRDKMSREMGWFNANQFASPWNLEAHKTTGEEIYKNCKEHGFFPRALVAGTGTGGTLMGAGLFLQQKYPIIHLVAVEPEESPVMSGGEPGIHGIQGIGDGSKFLVDLEKVSRVILVNTEEAKDMCKRLSNLGIFVGISAGANVLAALRYSQENDLENVITILCDRGERYLSLL